MVTDLTVTGRVAQFGRGVMADVSAKLLGQFVDCLENKLLVDVADVGDLPSAADARPAKRRRTSSPRARPTHGPLDLASEGAAAARALDLAADDGRGVDGVDRAARLGRPPRRHVGPRGQGGRQPRARAGRPARGGRRPGRQAGGPGRRRA